jgi:ferredoxin
MNQISFNTIKELFSENKWDVGYISAEQLRLASLHPIKAKFHVVGADYTNSIQFNGLTNAIVLIKDSHAWDYTLYDEAEELLKRSNFPNWFMLYTNYKEAAIQAGLGVRARNTLIYSYRFGFDCHITAVGFNMEIIDVPTNRRVNNNLWRRCKGCDDCRKACPVGAIHNEENGRPMWLDSTACDNFLGFGEHLTIPSVRKFWHEHVYPELSDEEVKKVTKPLDMPFDKNGFSFDGNMVKKDGKPVNVPLCKECTTQPRCSKWNGKYPYHLVAGEDITKPIFFKEFHDSKKRFSQK